MTPWQTNQAGRWLGPPLAETENNLTIGQKKPYTLATETLFIETASLCAGTSDEVWAHVRQLYQVWFDHYR